MSGERSKSENKWEQNVNHAIIIPAVWRVGVQDMTMERTAVIYRFSRLFMSVFTEQHDMETTVVSGLYLLRWGCHLQAHPLPQPKLRLSEGKTTPLLTTNPLEKTTKTNAVSVCVLVQLPQPQTHWVFKAHLLNYMSVLLCFRLYFDFSLRRGDFMAQQAGRLSSSCGPLLLCPSVSPGPGLPQSPRKPFLWPLHLVKCVSRGPWCTSWLQILQSVPVPE